MIVHSKVVGERKYVRPKCSEAHITPSLPAKTASFARAYEIRQMLEAKWGYCISLKEWVEILEVNDNHVDIKSYSDIETTHVVVMDDLCFVNFKKEAGHPIIGEKYMDVVEEYPFTLVAISSDEEWMGKYEYKSYSVTKSIRLKDVG